MKMKSRGIRGALSVATAMAVALGTGPAMAFADPTPTDATGDSKVNLYYESGQVSVTVPTDIPVSVDKSNNGVFTAPTNLAIKNNGASALHVSKVGVKASGVKILSKDAFATDSGSDPVVWSTVQPGAGQAIDLSNHVDAPIKPATPSHWNIAGSGSLPITLAGALKNSNASLDGTTGANDAVTAYTITWTVAFGEAPTQAIS